MLCSSDITRATWAAANTKGLLLMAFGGLSNILGTVFYNRAMQKGSASAVTGLSACYPAVTLLLAIGLVGCGQICVILLDTSPSVFDTTACWIHCASVRTVCWLTHDL